MEFLIDIEHCYHCPEHNHGMDNPRRPDVHKCQHKELVGDDNIELKKGESFPNRCPLRKTIYCPHCNSTNVMVYINRIDRLRKCNDCQSVFDSEGRDA
jgi:hypothetical protein